MSIPQQDFNRACTRLKHEWQRQTASGDWKEVTVREDFGTKWLRIACTAHLKDSDALALSSERDEAEKIVVEEDAEALVAPREPSEARVLYDIVHSPSYQVPVLYISLKDVPSRSRGLPPPEQVYGMLVPISFREQMEAVGPMGALSATDHPITSSPAYFVHPCRTAEAMEAVAGGKQLESQKYLLQWIGMVGQSVGLRVPTELAQAMLAKSAAIADDT